MPIQGIKRGRGRPRKVQDPRIIVACCATCKRRPCTSGLSDALRANERTMKCIHYTSVGVA